MNHAKACLAHRILYLDVQVTPIMQLQCGWSPNQICCESLARIFNPQARLYQFIDPGHNKRFFWPQMRGTIDTSGTQMRSSNF